MAFVNVKATALSHRLFFFAVFRSLPHLSDAKCALLAYSSHDVSRQKVPPELPTRQNFSRQNFPRQNFSRQNFPRQKFPRQNFPRQKFPRQNLPP